MPPRGWRHRRRPPTAAADHGRRRRRRTPGWWRPARDRRAARRRASSRAAVAALPEGPQRLHQARAFVTGRVVQASEQRRDRGGVADLSQGIDRRGPHLIMVIIQQAQQGGDRRLVAQQPERQRGFRSVPPAPRPESRRQAVDSSRRLARTAARAVCRHAPRAAAPGPAPRAADDGGGESAPPASIAGDESSPRAASMMGLYRELSERTRASIAARTRRWPISSASNSRSNTLPPMMNGSSASRKASAKLEQHRRLPGEPRDSRHQLLGIEGLGHVVVGAQLEGARHVLVPAARRHARSSAAAMASGVRAGASGRRSR